MRSALLAPGVKGRHARPQVKTRAVGLTASRRLGAGAGGRLPRGTLDFSAARHLVPVSSRRGCIQVLPCSRFRRRGRGGSERDPDGARAFPLHLRPPWGGGGRRAWPPKPSPRPKRQELPCGVAARGAERRGPGS